MKKFIAGFLSGAVIFGVATGFAVNSIYENPYRIFVNGEEKQIQGYNIDDYSYFKLRDIADAVGGFTVDFKNDSVQLYKDGYAPPTEIIEREKLSLGEGAPSQYGDSYHITVETAISLIKQRYGVDVVHTSTGNQFFWFEGGGKTFIVDRWYPEADIDKVNIGVSEIEGEPEQWEIEAAEKEAINSTLKEASDKVGNIQITQDIKSPTFAPDAYPDEINNDWISCVELSKYSVRFDSMVDGNFGVPCFYDTSNPTLSGIARDSDIIFKLTEYPRGVQLELNKEYTFNGIHMKRFGSNLYAYSFLKSDLVDNGIIK